MKMTASQILNIGKHYWLRHPAQSTYHAYTSHCIGTEPLCGDANFIENMADMDIPGDLSVTCLDCFNLLYNLSVDKL